MKSSKAIIIKWKAVSALCIAVLLSISVFILYMKTKTDADAVAAQNTHLAQTLTEKIRISSAEFGNVGYAYPWSNANADYIRQVQTLVQAEDQFVKYKLIPFLKDYPGPHNGDDWWNRSWQIVTEIKYLNSRREWLAGYNTRLTVYDSKHRDKLRAEMYDNTYPRLGSDGQDRISYVMLKYFSQTYGYWSDEKKVADVLTKDHLALTEPVISSDADVLTIIAKLKIFHDDYVNKTCNLSQNTSTNYMRITLSWLLGILGVGSFLYLFIKYGGDNDDSRSY